MPRTRKRPWPLRLLQSSTRAAFLRAYRQVQVDPKAYLNYVCRVHRLPIRSWNQMFLLGEDVITPIANDVISGSAKAAALEGAGLGIGGMLTLVPDAGVLAAITIRMLQKLSLVHGFEYATESESAELWLAAASAAGVDLGRDFLEKQATERLLPRIVDSVAVKIGADVAEKWSARLIPVFSAGAGAALNYYFVRSWGRRAHAHFLSRHRSSAARYLPPLNVSFAPAPRGIDPHVVPLLPSRSPSLS
ncbi:MAG TPA: EcsC family protein [Candidatus Acidoferrum sp.]|nr:EcsC family protein [Candidatus Acidoferrum sp.]